MGCSFLITTAVTVVIFYSLYVYYTVRTTIPLAITRSSLFEDNSKIHLIWNKFSLQNRKCLLSFDASNLSKDFWADFKDLDQFNGWPNVAEALRLLHDRHIIDSSDPTLQIAVTRITDFNIGIVLIKKSNMVYLFAHW